MRELGLGFTNPVGTGGVLDMCLCFGCWGQEVSTQFAQQLESAVTAPTLVGCIVWSPVLSGSLAHL